MSPRWDIPWYMLKGLGGSAHWVTLWSGGFDDVGGNWRPDRTSIERFLDFFAWRKNHTKTPDVTGWSFCVTTYLQDPLATWIHQRTEISQSKIHHTRGTTSCCVKSGRSERYIYSILIRSFRGNCSSSTGSPPNIIVIIILRKSTRLSTFWCVISLWFYFTRKCPIDVLWDFYISQFYICRPSSILHLYSVKKQYIMSIKHIDIRKCLQSCVKPHTDMSEILIAVSCTIRFFGRGSVFGMVW